MTPQELVARARAQIGLPTRYVLGGGRTQGEDPRDEAGGCDCSAFVCWCLGLAKYQPQFAWLHQVSGGWLNTAGLWWDAVREKTGYFEQIDAPEVGSIVVYPPAYVVGKKLPKIGHVGIVAEVGDAGLGTGLRVVHCSKGNFTRTGDAIQETGAEVFAAKKATIFARPSMVRAGPVG
jgi:cell wall-associated NlpC family hydrolase